MLREEDVLLQALDDLELPVVRGGFLTGFADQQEAVSLRTQLPDGLWLGWRRDATGRFALVGDLQQLGRCRSLQHLIGEITRRYAAHLALRSLREELPSANAELTVGHQS